MWTSGVYLSSRGFNVRFSSFPRAYGIVWTCLCAGESVDSSGLLSGRLVFLATYCAKIMLFTCGRLFGCVHLMRGCRWRAGFRLSRVEREVEFEISYMPHHNTLTKTGRANFSRLPDAVAELCDNSIQVRIVGMGHSRVGMLTSPLRW